MYEISITITLLLDKSAPNTSYFDVFYASIELD